MLVLPSVKKTTKCITPVLRAASSKLRVLSKLVSCVPVVSSTLACTDATAARSNNGVHAARGIDNKALITNVGQ